MFNRQLKKLYTDYHSCVNHNMSPECSLSCSLLRQQGPDSESETQYKLYQLHVHTAALTGSTVVYFFLVVEERCSMTTWCQASCGRQCGLPWGEGGMYKWQKLNWRQLNYTIKGYREVSTCLISIHACTECFASIKRMQTFVNVDQFAKIKLQNIISTGNYTRSFARAQ